MLPLRGITESNQKPASPNLEVLVVSWEGGKTEPFLALEKRKTVNRECDGVLLKNGK